LGGDEVEGAMGGKVARMEKDRIRYSISITLPASYKTFRRLGLGMENNIKKS
jgi:hypothetical protein